MKKLALCLTLVAIMMIPVSSFGLEMMNNNTMDQITGQAGVSIAFDDIEIFMNIDRFTYIDPDGLDSLSGWSTTSANNGAGAAFNVNEFQMDTLKINAIINPGTAVVDTQVSNGETTVNTSYALQSTQAGYVASRVLTPLQYAYNSTTAFIAQTTADITNKGLNNFTTARYTAQAVSIDITDQAPVLSAGFSWRATGAATTGIKIAAVTITLPTAEFYIEDINIGSMTLTDNVAQGTTYGTWDALNTGDSFGSLEIKGVTFAILDGWMEIAPH